MVQVRRRVIGRGKCPACEARKRKLKARFHKPEKEVETVRPVETILYYIRKAGIRLIRVIRDSSISYSNCVCIHIGRYWVSFDEALSAAFEMIGLDVEVDSKNDRAAIFDEFLRLH